MNKESNLPGRVNSFQVADDGQDDLTEFQPKAVPLPKMSDEELNKISEETGFARSQVKNSGKNEIEHKPSRRYKTGRNQQLNLKVKQETADRFYSICDELDIPQGAVFERAVAALETALKATR